MGIRVCLSEGVHLTSSLSRSDGGDSGELLKTVSQTFSPLAVLLLLHSSTPLLLHSSTLCSSTAQPCCSSTALPSAPPQLYPAAPPQLYPAAPPQLYPAAPPQLNPAAPAQFYPAAPPQLDPAAPPQLGPLLLHTSARCSTPPRCLLCGVRGASSQCVSPSAPPHHPPPPPLCPPSSSRSPSLESVIKPSWRGVKNIMQEGPPSKKGPRGTFSTRAVPSLTPPSALQPIQTSVSPLPPPHPQRSAACASAFAEGPGAHFLLVVQRVDMATTPPSSLHPSPQPPPTPHTSTSSEMD
ncbi:unnamed protein product [Pleuronectes platessa]|uniref:Uncharacterized protein n=1 Tax=Pleuronectes platessa TaxID=8262 RepID=A0A9N7UK78_PLEPL|nr:unnamed protein product [Pleuronectes platessa]